MTDKKHAAAIAAVLYYIKTQEEAVALRQTRLAQPQAPEAETAVIAFQAMNAWGVSGRQEQMQMRSMMQMKAFYASRRNR